MNYFTKYRVLVGAVILLAALNITILITLGVKKNQSQKDAAQWGPPRNEMQGEWQKPNRLEHELNLSPQQQEQFHELKREYFRDTKEHKASLQVLYRALMEELNSEQPDTNLLNRLAEQIGQLHTEQQKATFNHFLSLQKVCSHEQYQILQQNFMRHMGPQNGQRRGMNHNNQHRNKNNPMD